MFWRWLAVLLLAAAAFGADHPAQNRSPKRRWWVSVAALAAASALDMHSSWGKRELNPLLRSAGGRFESRGLAIKSSIVGTACGFEWLLLRKEPRLGNAFAGANLGLAAWTGGVAVRNMTR